MYCKLHTRHISAYINSCNSSALQPAAAGTKAAALLDSAVQPVFSKPLRHSPTLQRQTREAGPARKPRPSAEAANCRGRGAEPSAHPPVDHSLTSPPPPLNLGWARRRPRSCPQARRRCPAALRARRPTAHPTRPLRPTKCNLYPASQPVRSPRPRLPRRDPWEL